MFSIEITHIIVKASFEITILQLLKKNHKLCGQIVSLKIFFAF